MKEEEWIELICMGGKAADVGLRALYRELGPPMLRFFAFNGAPGDEAKDVLQETVRKVVKSASGYTGKGRAKSWIWQVARNCLIDHVKSRSRVQEVEIHLDDGGWGRLLESTPDPEQTVVERGPLDDCVSSGLNVCGQKMPDRVYVLTLQMEGASIEEISAQIGRSPGATKQYLSECRKKLKPFISHCLELLQA